MWMEVVVAHLFLLIFHSFHPSEADYLFPEGNLGGGGVSLFSWLLPLDLSLTMGASTSSYATASIALRVSGALKPHHHDKVETPSVGSRED
jgi:hypothetical protein